MGQNTQFIEASNVGATDYLRVARSDTDLAVSYMRRRTPAEIAVLESRSTGASEKCDAKYPSKRYSEDVVQRVIVWSFDTVFEYECGGVIDK